MSFLLDTDICSAHVKRPAGLMHRFMQHSGRLFISTVTLGELYVFAFQRSNPQKLIHTIEKDIVADLQVLDFDSKCAEQFGKLRGTMLQRGKTPTRLDLLIAATAICYQLVLVTHNTADYVNVPGIQLDDWLKP